MKRFKRMGIIILIIVIMLSELIVGLPFGHVISRNIALRYVRETYGFTPISAYAGILLHFRTHVTVEVEEQPFRFEVSMSRWAIPPIFFEITDNYLERKVEYILTRDLREYVEAVTNGRGRVWGSLVIGKPDVLRRFSLSELEINPNIAFEKLQGDYRVGIVLYDDIYDIDYDSIYGIYSRIFELGLSPHSIGFSFMCEEERRGKSLLSVTISYRHGRHLPLFSEINSVDDLRRVFEEAIRNR